MVKFPRNDQGWIGSDSLGLTLVVRPVCIQPWPSSGVRPANCEDTLSPRKAESFLTSASIDLLSDDLQSDLLRELSLLSHALFGLREHLLDQVFLREIGMVLQQFLP